MEGLGEGSIRLRGLMAVVFVFVVMVKSVAVG
jgi:hypothetical protein